MSTLSNIDLNILQCLLLLVLPFLTFFPFLNKYEIVLESLVLNTRKFCCSSISAPVILYFSALISQPSKQFVVFLDNINDFHSGTNSAISFQKNISRTTTCSTESSHSCSYLMHYSLVAAESKLLSTPVLYFRMVNQ